MSGEVVAAGALVWRPAGRSIEVLLVHRPSYDDWSIPKGKIKEGETLVDVAVREVEEETGVPIELGQPLGVVRYRLSDGRRKVCHYWVGKPLPEDSPVRQYRGKVKPAAKSEIDGATWVKAKRAMKMLTMKSDRELLGKVLDQFSDRKLDTWTVVLVRHGQAVKRTAWGKGVGREETRPLTKRGQIQAGNLQSYLSAYGVTYLQSSPWERCAATLRPYSESTGLGINERPFLSEHAYQDHPEQVKAFIDRELKVRDESTAICIHRPTLPTIMQSFQRRCPYSVHKHLPTSDPWLKPAEFLVAHVASPQGRKAKIVALEQSRPASKE